jgi:hypothetical protein
MLLSPPTCGAAGNAGDSCDAATPCRYRLLCSEGECVEPAADGSCDPSVGCAALPFYQYCDPSTNKCEPLLANLGEPCGPLYANASYVACTFGSACARIHDPPQDAGADAGDAGTPAEAFACVPSIENGQPCNDVDYPFGDPCMRGTFVRGFCVNHVCVDRSPATCTPPSVAP